MQEAPRFTIEESRPSDSGWDDPAAQFEAELGPGEQLLWSGRPRQGFMLRASDAFAIPFGLMWGGFAIFWEVMALRGGGPPFLALFGLPFVLIGLYMIIGRFFVEAKRRAKTFYAVTNERIIIISGLFRRTVNSLNVGTLTDMSLAERRNGSGTISFGGVPIWFASMPHSNWSGNWPIMPAFDTIPDVRQVYNLIRDAQRQSRKA